MKTYPRYFVRTGGFLSDVWFVVLLEDYRAYSITKDGKRKDWIYSIGKGKIDNILFCERNVFKGEWIEVIKEELPFYY